MPTLVRPDTEETELVAALRCGDEEAFAALVERYGGLMLSLARVHVRTRASAEEVVQETWCAVVAGIERFEGRSSLKTWLMRILTNRAKSCGERDRRCVPFSALAGEDDDDAPAVAPERFFAGGGGRWAAPPHDWRRIPEERLLMDETLVHLRGAIVLLPRRQQEVVLLRDVEGWSAEETCAALELSEVNQRVLLHRGRAHIRAALERYLDGEPGGRSAASATPIASHPATT
jgi:RNA polymerase sigma-70 factor (ECF subfamily)